VNEQCTAQSIQRTDFFFSRRALREAINWGDTQLRVHLERLVELEYVAAKREGAGGKFVYELAYVVNDETHAQVAGLIEVGALEALMVTATMAKSRGQTPEVAGRSRGDSGVVSGRLRGDESPAKSDSTGVSEDIPDTGSKTHLLRSNTKTPSYPHLQPLAAARR